MWKKFNRKRKHFNNRRENDDDEPGVNNEKTEEYNRKPRNQLREVDLGIEEYVTSKEDCIEGIIKARYSDFHVNEINLDGKEAILNQIAAPEAPKAEVLPIDELESVKNGWITPQIMHEIKGLCETSSDNQTPMKKSMTIKVTGLEKDARTMIHKDIKSVYQKKINSTTVTKDDEKFIEITRSENKNGDRVDWSWPKQYVNFVLYKENVETIQAISSLAHSLRMRPSNFNYAGTKDKRAKTTQYVSVRQVEPQRLVKATKRLNLIFVGNFTFCDTPLKLGMLKGNRFRIALRQVTTSEDIINRCLANFKEQGFINYFGTQRYGNSATVPTFEVGKALVKQNFKEACELILKPREGDMKSVETMRKTWWENRNAQEARDLLPKYSTFVEAKLLDGFIKTGSNDFIGALNNLPRNMRLLYMHSYQALIWNKIATLRIKKMGLTPCAGDLVLVKDTEEIRKNLDEIFSKEQDDVTDNVDTKDVKEKETIEKEDERSEARSLYFKNLVRPLSQEELHNYSIYDIVLPLVGHDITYPSNEAKDWYINLLQEDGLTIEALKTKHKIYSLAGTYRKLMIKPIDFQWSLKKYEKPEDNLILSDFEKLRGDQLPIPQNPTMNALILDFILPPSTYATMALREIIKKDTSPAAQVHEAEKNEMCSVEEDSNKRIKLLD